jgi:hypothetical protein
MSSLARAPAGLVLEIEMPQRLPDRVADDEVRRPSRSATAAESAATKARREAVRGVALVTRSVRLGNPCQQSGLIFSWGLVRVV